MLVFGTDALVLLTRRRFPPGSGFRRRLPTVLPQPGRERPAAPAARPGAGDAVPSEPEPSARAFPVLGLSPGVAAARALQATLQRLSGVSRAYVSPVTALAYVSYFPDEVNEEQLVAAIRNDGYDVADAACRFDWRHGAQA